MKCIPESRRVHLNMISTSVLLSLDWYICWWTISPGGYHTIIRPVVNASKLTWFILIVFLNDGMMELLLKLIKTKVLLTQARVTLLSNLAFSGFLPTTTYLAFQSFDLDRTWWRLFPKSVVHTKLDFYVFIRKHPQHTSCTFSFCWSAEWSQIRGHHEYDGRRRSIIASQAKI